MKITDVEASVLSLPEKRERTDGTQDMLLVRVETDAGIVGYGEVDSSPTVAKTIVDAPISHWEGLVNGRNRRRMWPPTP